MATRTDRRHANRATPGLFALVFIFAIACYTLTFSARPESGDALRVFDAASSLVQFGDLRRDEALWLEPPQASFASDESPLVAYEVAEPLAPIIASLFYRAGLLSPQIGLVHAVWLLNVIVLALSAALFYVVGCQLGYSRASVLVASVCLITCTAFWPYSKTLFREPLVTLFLLIATSFLLRIARKRALNDMFWLVCACLSIGLALMTKNSSLMALPALLSLLILPATSDHWPKRIHRALSTTLIVGVALVSLFAFVDGSIELILQPIQAIRPIDTTFIQIALHSYLFSVGGSIWGTSPVLLLALFGVWFLVQARRWREISLGLLMIAGYAVGHAVSTDVHWFGGLSWPPRFLVPAIPFAMLLTLPALERILALRKHYFLRSLAFLLAVYSFAIQVIAAVSFTDAYIAQLPEEANGLVQWLPGLNSLAHLRWVLLPPTWSSIGFDIAWVRAGMLIWIVIFTGLAVTTLFAIGCYRPGRRSNILLLIGTVGSLVISLGFGLSMLGSIDPFFWSDKQALFVALDHLEQHAVAGEPLLLADPTYDEFVMNHLDSGIVRPITFGFQPGEAVSPQLPPRVTSPYPPDLLETYVPRVIDQLAKQHDRIWLLAHTTPFLAWSTRPVERYLATFYYPTATISTDDPAVRLLSYSTAPAPTRYEMRLPEATTDLRFGDHIQLRGFTLPAGIHHRSGDALPITFFWETDALLTSDYQVAWFVVNRETGIPLAQGADTMPAAGFAPTTQWQPGDVIYDNRALQLSTAIVSGDYVIWVALYQTTDGEIERLIVTGSSVVEDTLGVLPVTLQLSD